MNNVAAIPYGRQHITEEDISAVIETLRSEYLTQGPRIAQFETAFAKYLGAKYAVAVSNGTAALHLSALAMNIQPGQNVITTPITFAASANAVRYCGGNVVFADIDPNTYLIDLNAVGKLLQSCPKGSFTGIIPVDFAGNALNMEICRQLADEFGLWIIEDACHAPGGYFIDSSGNRQLCGNGDFADLSVFSFHPVKHIACGEGGMITTNDKALYKRLLLLRSHGITRDPAEMHENHGNWYYEMQALGYNYRLTDFQAALGISQLNRADDGLRRRREIADRYVNAFKERSFVLGQSGSHEGHAYHLYVIEVKKRKQLYDYLRGKNIFCQIHYIPVHTLPYYRSLQMTHESHPMAERYYEHCISLPMFPSLTNEQQDYVIDAINSFYQA